LKALRLTCTPSMRLGSCRSTFTKIVPLDTTRTAQAHQARNESHVMDPMLVQVFWTDGVLVLVKETVMDGV
jgi:hypothetical protein